MKPKKYFLRPSIQIVLYLIFGMLPISIGFYQIVDKSSPNGYLYFLLVPIVLVAVMILIRKCDHIIIDNETLTVFFGLRKDTIELRNIGISKYREEKGLHQMVLKEFYIHPSDLNQRDIIILLSRYSKKDVQEIASLLNIDNYTI